MNNMDNKWDEFCKWWNSKWSMCNPDRMSIEFWEKFNKVGEESKANVKSVSWDELYAVYGERHNQEGLDLMDSIIKAIESEIQEQINI